MSTANDHNLPDPLIGQNPLLNISAEDLDNLDIEKLQEVMLKSVFIIEGSLFSQASMEHGRIQQVRKLLSEIEDSVDLKNLDDSLKIRYHTTVARTLSDSLQFLTKLHSSVADGMDITNKMLATKKEKRKVKTTARSVEDDEKKILLNEIRTELKRRVQDKEPF